MCKWQFLSLEGGGERVRVRETERRKDVINKRKLKHEPTTLASMHYNTTLLLISTHTICVSYLHTIYQPFPHGNMNKSKFYAELIIIMEFVFAHRMCVCVLARHLINFFIQIHAAGLLQIKRAKKNIYISSPGGVLSVSSTETRPLMVTCEQTQTPKQVKIYVFVLIVNIYL